MISREQLQSIEWAIKDEDGGSWCPACASPADIGHKCDCWLARALAAPPADAGAPPALVALVHALREAEKLLIQVIEKQPAALATPDTMPQVTVGDVIEWKAGHERVFQRLRTSIGAESWNTSLRDKLLGVYRPVWQRKE